MADRVAVALGSNLGDRRSHLTFAVERLGPLLSGLRVSLFRNTEPVGVPDPQPDYLNAAAIGRTLLDPHAFLRALLAIEDARGRSRPFFHAPRSLDLDLILFGDQVIDTPDLVVPHPRFRERAFVLEPLVELAPDWTDPVTGKTLRDLGRSATPRARSPKPKARSPRLKA